jgi:hypothetical protein
MTQEVLNNNAFFAYFFTQGDYIFAIFAGVFILLIFASILEFFLRKE